MDASPTPAIVPAAIPQDNTLDVSSIMDSLQKASSTIGASASDLTSSLLDAFKASTAQNQATQQEAEAKVTENNIQTAARAKENAQVEGAAAQFGTNPNAPESWIIPGIASSILDKEKDLQGRQQMIQSKMDTKPWDDPLSWLVNQFTLPMDMAAADNVRQSIADQSEMLTRLTQATDQAQKDIHLSNQADATKLADAKNKEILAGAAVDVAKSQQELARLGMEGANLKSTIADKQLQAVFQANNALAVKTDIAYKAAGLGLENQKLIIEKAQADAFTFFRQVEAAKGNEALQAQTEFTKKLVDTANIYGFKAPSYNEFQLMPSSMKEQWFHMIGMVDGSGGAGAGTVTAMAVEDLNAVRAPGTPGLNDTRNKLETIKNGVVQTASSSTGVPYDKMKPGEQMMVFQTAITAKVNQEIALTPVQGGIYSPPPLSVAITTSPVIAANPVSQLLAPIIKADPTISTDPNLIMQTAVKGILDKQLTPNVAAKAITDIFQGIQVHNNTIHQYQRLALPMLGGSAAPGMNMQVQMGFGFGGSTVLDMTNKAAVEGALTRLVIRNKYGMEPANIPANSGIPGSL